MDNRKLRNAAWALRHAIKLKATPKWVDKTALKEVYRNCPDGYHVDHIVPLKNELVCGLHVPCNLQYLTPFDNCSKGNKFIVKGLIE